MLEKALCKCFSYDQVIRDSRELRGPEENMIRNELVSKLKQFYLLNVWNTLKIND